MEMKFAIPKPAYPVRLALFAVFSAAGFALQIIIPGRVRLPPGVIVMVPGLVFLWAKNFKNKPMDIGQEDWQPASVREFDRIKSNIQLTRNKTYAVIYGPGFGWPSPCAFVAAFILSGLPASARERCLRRLARSCIPFLFTGNVSLWTPQELAFRMRAFEPILSSEKAEGGDIIITPYLRLDKDREGHQVPEDIRLMVEPRRKPADFLGVQLQVAVNKGPTGTSPTCIRCSSARAKARTTGLSSQRFRRSTSRAGRRHGVRVRGRPAEDFGHRLSDHGCRRPPPVRDGEGTLLNMKG